MIKLAVFDIDGTLRVVGKHYIPSSTLEALWALKGAGIRTAVASGRTIQAMDKEVLALDFDYYICANGGYTVDKDFEVLFANQIDKVTEKELVKYFEKLGTTLILRYTTGSVDICGADQMAAFKKVFFKDGERLHPPLSEKPKDEYPISGLCRLPDGKIQEAESFFSTISFYDALKGEFFDFQRKDVNKASAIMQLCSKLEIDIKETISFGDSYNDKEMMETTGISVAMGNAIEEIKMIADYVTTDIEDDGIFRAVNALIFNV